MASSIILKLDKAAKSKGGDKYSGKVATDDTATAAEIALYVPQSISRANKESPVQSLHMYVYEEATHQHEHACSVEIVVKLSKAASKVGGDKFESTYKDETFTPYIPQCISRRECGEPVKQLYIYFVNPDNDTKESNGDGEKEATLAGGKRSSNESNTDELEDAEKLTKKKLCIASSIEDMQSQFLNETYDKAVIAATSAKVTKESSYNNDFLWGVATAAYQIEGAAAVSRGMSIWDEFSTLPNKISNGDTGENADNSYYKYKEDIRLIKNMNGVNSYRFSISWSRIFPNGTDGGVNLDGIKHYNDVINEVIANDLIPLVTLYHWDLPLVFEQQYLGWLSPKITNDFLAYADVCFNAFGDRIKLWTTINEPWTFTTMGYVFGNFAPGRCSDRSRCKYGDSATEGYIVAHNVLNTHAAVVDLYRKKYQLNQNGMIGIVLNQDWAEPLTDNIEDIEAANRRNEFSTAWFADPLVFGRYPQSMIDILGSRLPKFTTEESNLLKNSIDFYAINHYSTKYYTNIQEKDQNTSSVIKGWAYDQHNQDCKYDRNDVLIGAQADSSWLNVVPWGLYKVLEWNHKRYKQKDKEFIIFITENGCDVPNESKLSLTDALNDTFRINYYQLYLQQVQKAIDIGIDVRGYFAWSLLDNFEWADGYNYRFGLHYVDYTDPAMPRHPKRSSVWYANYAYHHKKSYTSTSRSGSSTDDACKHSNTWQQYLVNAFNYQFNQLYVL